MDVEHRASVATAESATISRRELLRRAGAGAAALSFSSGLLAACGGSSTKTRTAARAAGYTIPKVDVNFGILPFGDQTLASIGVKKGWFEEVGISLKDPPYGTAVVPNQTVPLLANSQLDIETCWTPLFLQSMVHAPNLRVFGWIDAFYGSYVLASPSTGAKSIKHFIDGGASFDVAMKRTLDQVRGKRYAISNSGNSLPFFNALRSLGGLNLKTDTKLAVVEDPQITQLAIGDKIDFGTPDGAPQVARLFDEKWYPILGIEDIIRYGPPGAGQALVGNSGMATTATYLKNNRRTILRFQSVMFRIIDAVLNDPDSVIPIQLPYLESRAGGKVSLKAQKTVLFTLDPLTPFEKQKQYWTDTSSPFYFKTLYGAQLKAYQASGLLPKNANLAPEDLIVGDSIYHELVRLKEEYEQLSPKAQKLNGNNAALARQAKQHYDGRNYLDAVGMLKAALA